MIHEVLLALVGHSGDIVLREANGFRIASGLPFLSVAEQEIHDYLFLWALLHFLELISMEQIHQSDFYFDFV